MKVSWSGDGSVGSSVSRNTVTDMASNPVSAVGVIRSGDTPHRPMAMLQQHRGCGCRCATTFHSAELESASSSDNAAGEVVYRCDMTFLAWRCDATANQHGGYPQEILCLPRLVQPGSYRGGMAYLNDSDLDCLLVLARSAPRCANTFRFAEMANASSSDSDAGVVLYRCEMTLLACRCHATLKQYGGYLHEVLRSLGLAQPRFYHGGMVTMSSKDRDIDGHLDLVPVARRGRKHLREASTPRGKASTQKCSGMGLRCL